MNDSDIHPQFSIDEMKKSKPETVDKKYKSPAEKEIWEKIWSKKDEILESFCQAYCAETGLLPSEVAMCQQAEKDPFKGGLFQMKWWFQPLMQEKDFRVLQLEQELEVLYKRNIELEEENERLKNESN